MSGGGEHGLGFFMAIIFLAGNLFFQLLHDDFLVLIFSLWQFSVQEKWLVWVCWPCRSPWWGQARQGLLFSSTSPWTPCSPAPGWVCAGWWSVSGGRSTGRGWVGPDWDWQQHNSSIDTLSAPMCLWSLFWLDLPTPTNERARFPTLTNHSTRLL